VSDGKREEILGRIREALRVPAPRDQSRHSGGKYPARDRPETVREMLPAVPPDAEGRLALFREKSIQLKTDFHVVKGTESASVILKQLRDNHGWTSLASHRHALIDPLIRSLGLEILFVEERLEPKSLERCSVGITGCDALIAQTGSVLVTSRSAGGRALSVLPPHHVVIATRDQLLPDLPSAFELLYSKYGDRYPSFAGFITGPSRTGDIERIIVLGAHGPRNLTIILVDPA
jgi:L-lactate dehydrogenase complex protein LldG